MNEWRHTKLIIWKQCKAVAAYIIRDLTWFYTRKRFVGKFCNYMMDKDSKQPPKYSLLSALIDVLSEQEGTEIRRHILNFNLTRNLCNDTRYPEAFLNQLLSDEKIVCDETDNITDQLNPERRAKGIREEEKKNIKKTEKMMKLQYGFKRQKKAKKNRRS